MGLILIRQFSPRPTSPIIARVAHTPLLPNLKFRIQNLEFLQLVPNSEFTILSPSHLSHLSHLSHNCPYIPSPLSLLSLPIPPTSPILPTRPTCRPTSPTRPTCLTRPSSPTIQNSKFKIQNSPHTI